MSVDRQHELLHSQHVSTSYTSGIGNQLSKPILAKNIHKVLTLISSVAGTVREFRASNYFGVAQQIPLVADALFSFRPEMKSWLVSNKWAMLSQFNPHIAKTCWKLLNEYGVLDVVRKDPENRTTFSLLKTCPSLGVFCCWEGDGQGPSSVNWYTKGGNHMQLYEIVSNAAYKHLGPRLRWAVIDFGLSNLEEARNRMDLVPYEGDLQGVWVPYPDLADVSLRLFARPGRTLLLEGPPGTGKTTWAMQLGKRSLVVEACTTGWALASLIRLCKPDVLVLDDIDRSSNPYAFSFVPQLSAMGITVVATINNVEDLPLPMRRPGRFDEFHRISLPSAAMRHELMQRFLVHYGVTGISPVELEELEAELEGVSPATIKEMVEQASLTGFGEELLQRVKDSKWLMAQPDRRSHLGEAKERARQ